MDSKKITDIPLLSVIVPVKCMSGRLNLLESWLRQTRNLPIEVVIVHDIGDDQTSTELGLIINRNQNLRILFQEGKFGSPGSARNAGLRLASGKWVAFWDSDDFPHIDSALSAIVASANETAVIIGNFRIIHKNRETSKPHYASLSFVGLNPGIWRMIFRSNLLANHQFKPYRMGEDQLFIAELALPKRNIEFSNLDVYSYHTGNPGQLTSTSAAVSEGSFSLSELAKLMKNQETNRNHFCEIVKTKLFFTSVKTWTRGNIKTNPPWIQFVKCGIKWRYIFYVIALQGLYESRIVITKVKESAYSSRF